MSKRSSLSDAQGRAPGAAEPNQLRRYGVYGGIVVLAIIGLAYFDAGEEPIHPIVQAVAVPAESGARQ